MVIIEGLSFSYKKELSLFLSFSWNIARGERWSIIGPSGCGKTTLLYLLAGLRSPASGKIVVDGHADGRKTSTGLILQDYGLVKWMRSKGMINQDIPYEKVVETKYLK